MNNLFRTIFILYFLFLVSGCTKNYTESQNEIEEHEKSLSNNEDKFKKANYFEASKINAQLGIYYLDKGLYKRAKEKLLTSLKQYHDYGPNLTAMAYYYEKTGDEKLADHYYNKALKVSENNGIVFNNYGTFLCRKGEYKKAIIMFNKATNDINYLNSGEALENAALCAQSIPDIALAKKYYENALKKNPALPTSLYELAKINYNQKNYKISRNYLNEFRKYSGKKNGNYVYLDNLLNKIKT